MSIDALKHRSSLCIDDLNPRLQKRQESEWFCVLSGWNLVSLFQTLIGRQQLCPFLCFWKHHFGSRFIGKHEIALPSTKARWTGHLDKGGEFVSGTHTFLLSEPKGRVLWNETLRCSLWFFSTSPCHCYSVMTAHNKLSKVQCFLDMEVKTFTNMENYCSVLD